MAKIQPGSLAGAISGAVGGDVFSRNRYGAYVRRRAIPVNPQTSYQLNARARLSGYSAAFAALTAAQQEAWNQWADLNPITDRLGQKQALSGHAAYVALNCRLNLCGDSPISVRPVTPPPGALESMTVTGDIGAGTFAVAYTATPLGADDRLVVQAAIVDSAGITYVKNRYKFMLASAKAQASPVGFETEAALRFGTLQVGQVVHALALVHDSTTGLWSPPRAGVVTITST